MLHDRVLGSLGQRLLMTSTQEPNTMAPQSALCIWLRKWKAKLVVPIYFGTKTSEFWLRSISCSSLESSFDLTDFEKTSSAFDNCEITAWSFESILQYFKRRWGRAMGKASLRTSCLYIRNAKLDMKWRTRKTKSRKEKSRTALDGKLIT